MTDCPLFPTWFDAHLHLQDERLDNSREIAREMKRVGVDRAVINATRQCDWNEVHKLIAWSMGEEVPELLPAYGVHPWQAHSVGENWLSDLQDYLATHPHSSIGEVGLDCWIDHPNLNAQLPIFRAQLQLAKTTGKTLSIHCLKAFGPMMKELKACSPSAPFLMHSYGGSIEYAHELLDLGAYFSFSGYFLQPHKAAVREVFRQLPSDRILIETDAPDMALPETLLSHPMPCGLNHPANIHAIGVALAEQLELEPIKLAEQTARNARACFQL